MSANGIKNQLIKDALGHLAILKITLDKIEVNSAYSYEEKALKVRIVEIRDLLIKALNHSGPGDEKTE